MTIAPESRAAGRLRLVNAAEPAKKMSFAREKVPSSTGWITAGAPPASVNVPAAGCSSTKDRTQQAEGLFSRRGFKLCARGDGGPTSETLWGGPGWAQDNCGRREG